LDVPSTARSPYHALGEEERVTEVRFGEQLREVRKLARESLRAVASATGISAAYLLKLEQGTVTSPSPHILLKLSRHFGVSYTAFMALAGYQTSDAPKSHVRTGVLAEALAAQELSPEQERAVVAFLASLRDR
jgi:transcriptional regulator with XRE-family HTH domain